MSQGIFFAVVAALAFGLWTVFHDQASKYIDPLFGAIIVSLTAVILGVILLIPRINGFNFHTDVKGLTFVILAGVCALGLDFFALKAYGVGLPVSVGGPIIIGGSVAVAALIGFILGETINLQKILGLLFVIIGVYILSSVVK